MEKIDLIEMMNSKDKNEIKKACYYIIENKVSLMNVIIEALNPNHFGNEVILAILIEGNRKNSWLFPLLLKLLYNDPNYLYRILGQGLFDHVQRVLASCYCDDETCNSLLLHFICDKKLPQFIRSIGLDCLSLLHINNLISEKSLNNLFDTIYHNLDNDIINDFVIIATDNGFDYNFEEMFKNNLINKEVYTYEQYIEEKQIPFSIKCKEFLKNPFFNPLVDIDYYINNFINKNK